MITYNKALCILRKPIVTEKRSMTVGNNEHSFVVDLDANKIEIAEAIKVIFNIDVKTVRTMIRKGKKTNFRGNKGQRSHYKIANVVFTEKTNVDFSQPIKMTKTK